MDWFASGVRNSFEYEMYDPWLRSPRGMLEVVSCSISEGYYTDSKARADVECDAESWFENSALRVWHTARLAGGSVRECLGTFVPDEVSETRERGARTLSLSMMHPIDKMATDLRCGDVGVAAGTEVSEWVRTRIEDSGCTAAIDPALAGRTLPTSWVWGHGESVLSVVDAAASAAGCVIGAEPDGSVSMRPYVAPSRKSPAWELPASAVTSASRATAGDVCNRVVVAAESDGARLSAWATVDPSHPWAFQRLGRWFAKSYEERVEPFDQATVQALADHYMALNDDVSRKWEVSCLYFPCRCGEVVVAELGGERVAGMVQQRELVCDAGMATTLILDEVA